MKTYTSREGLQFRIVSFPRPSENEIVYFTTEEWLWIKSKSLTSDQFRFIWNAKKNDYTYQVISDLELSESQRLANSYVPKILDILKGKKECGEKEESSEITKSNTPDSDSTQN